MPGNFRLVPRSRCKRLLGGDDVVTPDDLEQQLQDLHIGARGRNRRDGSEWPHHKHRERRRRRNRTSLAPRPTKTQETT
jgi:hypothetical protein